MDREISHRRLTRGLVTRILAIVIGAAALPASAATLLSGIALQWRPTETVTVPGPVAGPATATIALRPLVDRRPNPEKIAENIEGASEGKILPVTTRDDVGGWATAHLSDLMTQGGYPLVDGPNADLVLSGEVLQFFVTESDSYRAEVRLHLTLAHSDGTVVWTGTGVSQGSRSGRSYKADNYCEVLSDSFVKAVQGLLEDAKFQQVLAKSALPAQ